MVNWSEKCLTCQKAGSIAKWGWMWACDEPECNYEPCGFSQFTIATNTTKK